MTDVEPYDRVGALEEQVRLAERRAGAVRLRNAGASIARVALALGYADEAEAARDITTYLDDLLRIPASEMVARQQAIIMDMTRACYTDAMSGSVESVTAIRQLMDHQAKLFGLYAPTRHKVSAEDNSFSDSAARLIADLGVQVEAPAPPTIDADETWATDWENEQ
jgi:hypothetical protein